MNQFYRKIKLRFGLALWDEGSYFKSKNGNMADHSQLLKGTKWKTTLSTANLQHFVQLAYIKSISLILFHILFHANLILFHYPSAKYKIHYIPPFPALISFCFFLINNYHSPTLLSLLVSSHLYSSLNSTHSSTHPPLSVGVTFFFLFQKYNFYYLSLLKLLH